METQNINISFHELCWDELRGPDELSKTIMLFFLVFVCFFFPDGCANGEIVCVCVCVCEIEQE